VQQRENDLKKLGRDVGALAAVEVPYGAAIGACNCATADCVNGKGPQQSGGGNGTLRLSAGLIGPNQPGILKSSVDAIKVVDHVGMPVPIALSGTTVMVAVDDPSPDLLIPAPQVPWSLAVTSKHIDTYGPFDVAIDGKVTYADVMDVAIG